MLHTHVPKTDLNLFAFVFVPLLACLRGGERKTTEHEKNGDFQNSFGPDGDEMNPKNVS